MIVHVTTKHYPFNSKKILVNYSCLTDSVLKYTNMILPIVGHLPVAVSVLSAPDYQHLKATDAIMFHHEILDAQMTRSIKIYKSITLYGQFIGTHKQNIQPIY